MYEVPERDVNVKILMAWGFRSRREGKLRHGRGAHDWDFQGGVKGGGSISRL